MKRHAFLSCICLLLLVSLVAVPVLAAATLSSTVTCPPTCSCLLPAEAKKLGYPGYCNGNPAVCGNDGENKKYCYAKPVTTTTMPPLILSAKTFATTTPTTVPPQKCASGCTCLSTAAGKGKGLAYCNNRQTLCGHSTDNTPLYCFALPSTPTTVPTFVIVTGLHVITTTSGVWDRGEPLYQVAPCNASCTCLSPSQAMASTLSRCGSTTSLPCNYDTEEQPMYCYAPGGVSMVRPVSATTTAALATSRVAAIPAGEPEAMAAPAPVPSENIITAVTGFFSSLFGSGTPPRSSSSQPVPCNGIVTNLMTDPKNCGSCGAVCSSGSCVMGQCRDTSDYVYACGPGAVTCDGACTYLLSDDNNCGTCGNICDSGLSCCGGQCVDRVRDSENCGNCGRICSGQETCCTYKCVDTSQDRLNCGECRHRCPEGYSCSFGGCINTAEDDLNCGGRGMRCAYEEECCSSRCVNTAADNNNCGACGQTCISPEVCYNGECVDTTTDEYHCGNRDTICGRDETCCSGECINLALDNDSHCGGCGHTCLNGARCCSGTCRFLTTELNCGACGVTCDEHLLCCDGVCIWNNDDHCGSCHTSCGRCQECDGDSCETSFVGVLSCIIPSFGF